MRISFNLLPLSILLLTMVACEKNKEDRLPPRSELLMQGSWKHTSSFYEESGLVTPEGYNYYPECEKDNEYTFRDDGTFQITEGRTACNTGGPTVLSNGSWAMNTDDKYLQLQEGSFPVNWEILKLTRDSMILRISSSNSSFTDAYAH